MRTLFYKVFINSSSLALSYYQSYSLPLVAVYRKVCEFLCSIVFYLRGCGRSRAHALHEATQCLLYYYKHDITEVQESDNKRFSVVHVDTHKGLHIHYRDR